MAYSFLFVIAPVTVAAFLLINHFTPLPLDVVVGLSALFWTLAALPFLLQFFKSIEDFTRRSLAITLVAMAGAAVTVGSIAISFDLVAVAGGSQTDAEMTEQAAKSQNSAVIAFLQANFKLGKAGGFGLIGFATTCVACATLLMRNSPHAPPRNGLIEFVCNGSVMPTRARTDNAPVIDLPLDKTHHSASFTLTIENQSEMTLTPPLSIRVFTDVGSRLEIDGCETEAVVSGGHRRSFRHEFKGERGLGPNDVLQTEITLLEPVYYDDPKAVELLVTARNASYQRHAALKLDCAVLCTELDRLALELLPSRPGMSFVAAVSGAYAAELRQVLTIAEKSIPNAASTVRARAVMDARKGQPTRAIEALKALQGEDDEASLKTLKILRAIYKSLFEEGAAVDISEEIYALEPDNKLSRKQLIEDSMAATRFKRAAELEEAGNLKRDNDADYWLKEAERPRIIADQRSQIDDIEKAISIDAMRGDLRHKYAFLLYKDGRYEEAVMAAERASDLGFRDELGVAAHSLLLIGKAQAALDASERMIAAQIRNGHSLKAEALVKMGRVEDAIAHLSEQVEKEPDSITWLSDRADIEFSVGDPIKALTDYSNLLQSNLAPGFKKAGYRAVLLTAELIDIDSAYKLLEKVAHILPDIPRCHNIAFCPERDEFQRLMNVSVAFLEYEDNWQTRLFSGNAKSNVEDDTATEDFGAAARELKKRFRFADDIQGEYLKLIIRKYG